MPRVAILGGGVSGLAAAFRLGELSAQKQTPIEVALFEQASTVGGCIQTLRVGGFVMELGPDSLLVDKPSAAALLDRLHLRDRVLDMRPEFKGARIVHAGRLHPIPPEFRLFSPTSIPALLGSGIFSPIGIARAAMEPFIPPRNDARDESLASFVTRRFGREVLERLAQPLIGGIYSGDPKRLSMRATLPQFMELERRYGSLLRAMQRSHANGSPPRLASLQNGVGSLIDALRTRVQGSIHTGAQIVRLQREGAAWTIGFADGAGVQADAVICALPAHVTAALLRVAEPELAQMLSRIRYNSIATVNLMYDAAATAQLPPSTGFVAPFVERRRITAATFTTQKYAGRAPAGAALLRAFIGGALQGDLVDRPDDELAAIAHEELAQIAGVSNKPLGAYVTRWQHLLPEYGVGHVDLLSQIEQRVACLRGGLALAGSAYRGVGIPDCVATGEAGADSVFGYIAR